MTKATPEIEALAAERLAKDEARITGAAGPGRRTGVTLGESWRAFWRHPSPPMISTFRPETFKTWPTGEVAPKNKRAAV